MPHASFEGLRVLSLETRREREVEKLIRTYNGDPLVVPSMREIPLSSNTDCVEFGHRLLAGEIDLIVFMTGVGVAKMMEVLSASFDREKILQQLRNRQVVARGVKPVAALRELQIPVAVTTAEPSTWLTTTPVPPGISAKGSAAASAVASTGIAIHCRNGGFPSNTRMPVTSRKSASATRDMHLLSATLPTAMRHRSATG